MATDRIVGWQYEGYQYCTRCAVENGYHLKEDSYPIFKGDPDWGWGMVPVCEDCNEEINTIDEEEEL